MADDIIDFKRAWERRHNAEPDPEHMFVDLEGVTWYRFTCSYKDGDKSMGFDLWAKDFEDAARRIALISTTGCVDGQVYTQRRYE